MDARRGPWLLFLVTLTLGVVVPFSQQCPCEDLGSDHFCSILTNGTGRLVVLPNALGEHDLSTAKTIFENLGLHRPHLLSSCSEFVDEYLCVLFFPVCRPATTGPCQQLGPCRELCIKVNSDCRDELNAVKTNNPDLPEVNCSNLISFQEASGHCVVHLDVPKIDHPTLATGPTTATPLPGGSESAPDSVLCGSPRACTDGLVPRTGSMFAEISNCSEPCPGVHTSDADNVFATAWLSIWSVLCLLLSIATIVCWSISYRSYHYPQTPILHIAVCYAGISLTYIIALAAGEQTICYIVDETAGANSSGVADGKFSTAPCILTFVVGYFFTVASWFWWLIVAITWFLQAPLKFQGNTTEMKGLQVIYHLVAWGVPLLLTVIATGTQSFGANSITRLCQISVHNSAAQIGFSVVPQLLAVFVCIVLLLAGHLKLLISADSNKKPKQPTPPPPPQQQQQQQTQCNSKEWSTADLIKADIFCVLFLVQMTVSSSVNMYHFRSITEWEQYYITCDRCNVCSEADVRPLFGVFMWKLTVELLMGCLLVLWLKPRAVLNGWKGAFKCFSKSEPQRVATPATPSTPTTPTWSSV